MAKNKKSRRAASKKFDRGCLLSGCLCYLGCASLVLVLVGALSIALITGFATKYAPRVEEVVSPLLLFITVGEASAFFLVLGVAEFLQLRAVWQGYRWGAYGLALIVLSQIGLAVWGETSLSGILTAAWGTAYNNVPLLILFLLLRPKWKAMR